MSIHCIELDCGATLVVEPIANVASAAVNWLVPLGSSTDGHDEDGHATLFTELLFRGAGGLNSREHSDAFDRLGAQRSASVAVHHIRIGLTCLGKRLHDSLDLVGTMVLDPMMPAQALDPVRSLCLQAIESLEDDPQHLVMLRLRQQHEPAPFNRHGYGERDVLNRTTIEDLRAGWSQRCLPKGTIISAAGAVDVGQLTDQLNRMLANWSGARPEPTEETPARGGQVHHDQDTAQVHIGMACDAPTESDPDCMLERLGIAVLSGGTSARLFTEVRQKRSLCYSVGASYRAGRDRGIVALYAGTTPERAQQTLDVCLDEFNRMSEGVEAEELARATVGIKSSLIMQGESTGARSATIAHDFFRLGRTRSLEELAAAIDAITLDELNDYLSRRVFGPFTITSIGPVAVGLGEEVASP